VRKHTPRHNYTPEEIRFIKRKIAGRSYAEMTGLFNERFGLSITLSQMKGVLKRHGLCNGRDCRFRPGLIPPNKGKKGYCSPGSEKGWFRPGNRPWDWQPVGTERINDMGYIDVRIRNPSGNKRKNWKAKHRIIWEKAYGKIPKGRVIIFADGNKLNVRPDNLLMVSRKELAVMNRHGLISVHKDLTGVGKTIADIKLLIAERKRGIRKKLQTGKKGAGNGKRG
jgi:hypothetical protein